MYKTTFCRVLMYSFVESCTRQPLIPASLINCCRAGHSLSQCLCALTLFYLTTYVERMNAKIVTPRHSDLHSEEERMAIRKAQEENKQYLSIPRR